MVALPDRSACPVRFLYVWPEPAPIAQLILDDDAEAGRRHHRLISAARRLSGLTMDGDPAGDPAPRILRLDIDALGLFDELRREAIERSRGSRGLAAGWHGPPLAGAARSPRSHPSEGPRCPGR